MSILYLVLAVLAGVTLAIVIFFAAKAWRSSSDQKRDKLIVGDVAQNQLHSEAAIPSHKAEELNWSEVQEYLPSDWRPMRTVPADAVGRLEPVNAIFAQGILQGALNAMPALSNAVNSAGLFQMVGPPEALSGIKSGDLNFMFTKSGEQMMDLVDSSHTIRHKARVVPAGGQAKQMAIAAGTFQLLSVATSQYYLHQINEKLQTISLKLDEVLGKLDDRRFGKVAAAMEIIDEVYEGALKELGHGGLEQLTATTEFWSRMANAEQALREVVAECERDYSRHRTNWLETLGERTDDGWRRRKSIKRNDIQVFSEISQWQSTVGEIHTIASQAMFKWYQVALAHDSATSSQQLRPRYDGMMKYVSDRSNFWRGQSTDADVFMAWEGGHAWDTTKDLISIAAAITFIPAIVAESTDNKHNERHKTLMGQYDRWAKSIAPVLEMDMRESPVFFIEAEQGLGEHSYRLLRRVES